MNGSKFSKFASAVHRGAHNHIHGVSRVGLVTITEGQSIGGIIAKDRALKQDHSATRASFQGRFRKTSFGDFKNRPGHGPEMVEAQIEDHEREDAKAEWALGALDLAVAAADAGMVIEENPFSAEEIEAHRLAEEAEDVELHRLADDGGSVHE